MIEKKTETVTKFNVLGTWVKEDTARKLYDELRKEFDPISNEVNAVFVAFDNVSLHPNRATGGGTISGVMTNGKRARVDFEKREWDFLKSRLQSERYF